MSNRFTHIINGLKVLREIYPNNEMVNKMLNSLSKSWEPKVTIIEETKDLNLLLLDELISSLLTYKMKINHNAQEIKEAPKKVGVPFKSTTCEKDEGSSNDEEGEEEMTMFAKKFKKFMKFNKAERFRRRDIIKGEPSKKENKSIIFYECKKSSHIKFDYPQLKKKGALKQNKKAMMATWSYNDSSDSDEDNEVANLCFMVIEKPKEEEHCFKASNSKNNS
ncbi:hypothetical protein PVK06_020031 [Gossypium arboreum]|uniref:UBN2 domain-containing protein n=1 Tax=Gossypium arboreum TaxID=29729 RepID=A0ABR0PLQ8_GOSAR|nr:hypothetical protein PVK06_020031 [Gossypium arboreum]